MLFSFLGISEAPHILRQVWCAGAHGLALSLPRAPRRLSSQELAEPFRRYLGPQLDTATRGADSGAKGRKNTAQRLAARGTQPDTYLAWQGTHLLRPGDSAAEGQVAAAQRRRHPRQCPPDLPWKRQYAAPTAAHTPVAGNSVRDRLLRRLDREPTAGWAGCCTAKELAGGTGAVAPRRLHSRETLDRANVSICQ